MVARLGGARTARGTSPSMRMSLTPESTAESAMKSALKASAISRAIVVLPTPGGPHRIIECSRPDSNASRRGFAGARHRRAGRAVRARGKDRSRRSLPGCRSLVADDVGALGRGEAEERRIDAGVPLEPGEAQQGRLAEGVRELHPLEARGAEANADPLEGRFLLARHGLYPLEPILGALVLEHERFQGIVGACEQ